ncbi:MAG: hypothetical protein M3P53_01305 [Actinomycetota bacterium]|nr:hypothetical protein [Actinomycetota bacterium]
MSSSRKGGSRWERTGRSEEKVISDQAMDRALDNIETFLVQGRGLEVRA